MHGFIKDQGCYSNMFRFGIGDVFWNASVKHSKCKTKGNVERMYRSLLHENETKEKTESPTRSYLQDSYVTRTLHNARISNAPDDHATSLPVARWL